MKSRVSAKATAVVLVFLLGLGLPATLSAKQRRGADVVITRLDGQQVAGELVAVTSDSVVVLCAAAPGAGRSVVSVDIKTVQSIKVARRSRAGTGAGIGFLAGAAAGALWGSQESDDDNEELAVFFGALLIGAVGGLVGLVAGAAAGTDNEITLAGQTDPAVRSSLAKLARLARERGTAAPPESIRPVEREARQAEAGAAPRSEAASPAPERPRFKLTWSPMFVFRPAGPYSVSSTTDGTFRFIGDYSDVTGPFAADVRTSGSPSRYPLGCLSFAYRWNRRISSEIELYAPRGCSLSTIGELRFTSTLDGEDYSSSYFMLGTARSTSILVGLNVRPFPSGFLLRQHQEFEIAIAAGPAFARITQDSLYVDQPLTFRGTTLTARARVAYDFYFGRSVCIGFFGEYRRLKPHIPEYTGTADLNFSQEGSVHVYITRTTSVTFPGRTFDMGGYACGMRFGLSF